MPDPKFKNIDIEKIQNRQQEWIDQLLQQNRDIIHQNQMIIQHNVRMMEQLGRPIGRLNIGNKDQLKKTLDEIKHT